jgi:hypothetical protein
MRLRGDNRKPEPPRDVIAQAGSRSTLVTWKPPIGVDRVGGYRIYTPRENDLFDSKRDPDTTSVTIPLSSGASPTAQAVYISCVSPSGIESNKVQVIAIATAEAGAPSVPTVPVENSVVQVSPDDTDVYTRSREGRLQL